MKTLSSLLLALLLSSAACDAQDVALETDSVPSEEPQTAPETSGADPHAHHHAHHEVLAAGDVVPGSSIYQLDVDLVAQDGQAREWDTFRGEPVIVSMVYSSCTTACPMIVNEIKLILEKANKPDHPVLLVSLDPARDDAAKLAAMVKQHGLGANWTLVRPAHDDVAEVAAALGVRYRKLPSMDFNHSQVIALLDDAGTIVARAEGLGSQRDAVIEALK